jgi:hypothetical protein
MNSQSNDEREDATRQGRRTLWKMLGLSFLSGLGGGTPVIKHRDERIAATSQKWAAFSGAFLSIAIGIDIMVRILILRQDFPVEICLIWMANLFIVGIGQIRSGVPAAGTVGRSSWKISALMIVEIALLVPAVLWLMGMVHSWVQYAAYVALAGVSAFVMQMIMRGTYRRWERRTLGASSDDEAHPASPE